MAMKDLNHIHDELEDIADSLDRIDFDTPAEPSESADQEDWRAYAMIVADKLADAETAVSKASDRIRS